MIAFRIGRPLIGLNFLNEALNASFRYALVRLRDNSESIAFYRGEGWSAACSARFRAVIDNVWAIVFRTLKFQGFNVIVSQFAQIIPLVLQAPRYFAGQITLGDVQQTASAFGQVHDALSFFRLAYDDFASYRAVAHPPHRPARRRRRGARAAVRGHRGGRRPRGPRPDRPAARRAASSSTTST